MEGYYRLSVLIRVVSYLCERNVTHVSAQNKCDEERARTGDSPLRIATHVTILWNKGVLQAHVLLMLVFEVVKNAIILA